MLSFLLRYVLPITAFGSISYYFIFNSRHQKQVVNHFVKEVPPKHYRDGQKLSEHLHSIIVEKHNPAIKKK